MASRLDNSMLGKPSRFDPAYLPAEILFKIISIAVQPTNQIYTHMFPLALASVNQSWRAFVLDSPHIWAFFCVDLMSPVSIVVIQMFLERSRSFPLDIVLYSPDTVDRAETLAPPEAFLITLLQALNPHQGRWRSFKLYLSTHWAIRIAISNFRGVAESLEELVLEGRHRGVRFNSNLFRFHTRKPEFCMAMPAIRHLTVAGWIIPQTEWATKMQGLTSFTLTGSDPDDEISRAVFSKFIRDISVESTLEVVEFKGGQTFYPTLMPWGFPPSDPPTPRLQLPHLKEIRLTNCSSNFTDEITACLEAPNLETLEFFVHPDPLDMDEHFMRMVPHPVAISAIKQFPKLRSFRLIGPRRIGTYVGLVESCESLFLSGIRDIAGMLNHLGTFHEDITHAIVPQNVWWANARSFSPVMGWCCPRLLSLEIYHCDGLNPARLQDVLAARKDAASLGSPVNAIISLVVHHEQELSEDDRAWFEANLAMFQWIRCDRPPPPASPAPLVPPKRPKDRPSWREVWY